MTKTVKVRIAVAVDPNGWDWRAYGDAGLPDHAVMSSAVSTSCQKVFWVTAELPIPEPKEVEGEVEGGC